MDFDSRLTAIREVGKQGVAATNEAAAENVADVVYDP